AQDYQLLLHRSPDPTESATWLQFLDQGGTFEQLLANIAGSPEYFQSRAGQTNDGFLDALYSDLFNRSVDSVGRQAWDQAFAAGASTSDVALGIAMSVESWTTTVANFYQDYLHRFVDPSGLGNWLGLVGAGPQDQQVIASWLTATYGDALRTFASADARD